MARRRRKTLVVCHHCHVAIHRGTLTNRLRALIDEGKLSPTGEWVLPFQEEPTNGKARHSKVSSDEKSRLHLLESRMM